jgi:hypothetical protein
MSTNKITEIAAKENITSGFPLTATHATLHRKLVSLLAGAANMPLDVFEQVEVVREEHYCVPAYCFYCNASSSFSYEAGVQKRQTYTADLGDKVRTTRETWIEWNVKNGSVSISKTIFAPGNKKFAYPIMKLYRDADPKKWISTEELNFPPDVDTHSYDLPMPAAFSEYVASAIDKALEEKAHESVKTQYTQNFSFGGSNMHKEVVHVFLGLYRIVFKYKGKEYYLWVSGNGEKSISGGVPEDAQRQQALEEKQKAKEQALANIPVPKTGWLNFGKWICILAGILFLLVAFTNPNAGDSALGGSIAAISIGLAIFLGVVRSKKRKPFLAKKSDVEAQAQKEIDDFAAQPKAVLEQFKDQKKALRGIYEDVTGNAKAF